MTEGGEENSMGKGLFSRFRGLLSGYQGEKERREREDRGCVMRALESAFEARATEQEWGMRMADIRRLLAEGPNPFTTNDPTEVFLRTKGFLERDSQAIVSLIGRIARLNTPLSQAIRKYDGVSGVYKGAQVREVLKEGKVVLIAQVTASKQHHLAHIIVEGERIVSKSDGGIEVPLGLSQPYEVFVFTKTPVSREK